MALNKYKIGDLIEIFSKKCDIPNLTINDVSGINRDKEFFEPAKQVGKNTSDYKVVPPDYFACNLMHVGRDVVLPIALNCSQKNKIVSPAYTVFKIADETIILKEFFFMLLNSDEKDRFFWFNTDSSVREGLPWETFCDIEIEFPTIEIQKKYVNVYKAMVANQKAYEKGLDDFKLVCDAYIEDLRRKYSCEKIGPYIEEVNIRNVKDSYETALGVDSSSSFVQSRANLENVNLTNYKIVKEGQFAYNPSRINLGSIALNRGSSCIISPMYTVFEVINPVLDSKYLMMWLARKEFHRSTLFYANGSVRDTFDFDLMKEVKIPIPSLDIQQNISKVLDVYVKRGNINEQLKAQIKEICPVLIQGALQEGRKEDI